MRWEDERYVRIYTRDTTDWLAFSFEAQALLLMLLRKVDRAGILPLGKHGKRGVAIAIGHPREWERLESAFEELLADGCVRVSPDGTRLVIPNFIFAQEARASDKSRQQKSREFARDLAASESITSRDGESQIVTECHTQSHEVTPSHTPSPLAVPSRAVPSQETTFAPASADASGRPALVLMPAEPDKPEPRRPRKSAPAEPTGDPRHAVLVKLLVSADTEITGKPYGFRGGRDAKAVTECLALADQDPATAGELAGVEVLRRWRIGRQWQGFPLCGSISDLAANWNTYVAPHRNVARAEENRPRLDPPSNPQPAVRSDKPRL